MLGYFSPIPLEAFLCPLHIKANRKYAFILPGVTRWQSPNYFSYFPFNSSVVRFLGEMLNGGINMVGFIQIATELEMIVLNWLANLLKLPNDFLSKGIWQVG